MPKREHQLLGFHGGINDNSDPKDIEDIELREADGVSVHKLGRLVGIGSNGSALSGLSNVDNDIKKSYGLHFFSTDRDKDGAFNAEDWISYYSNSDHKVKFYHRGKASGSAGTESALAITFDGTITPNYYFADGALRIGDSTFSQSSKWHGFIDSILFQTDNTGATNNVLGINKWINTNQKLQGFDDLLGNANLKLVLSEDHLLGSDDVNANAMAGNLSNTNTGNANGRKLILSYWTGESEDGQWNGTYQFAATPLYVGNQEGPISVFPTTVNFYNNQVSFQVHIPIGTSNNPADDADLLGGITNPLGDERIIGINFYFRSSAQDDWKLLMTTDLLEGGPNYWAIHDAADEKDGIFEGSVTKVDGDGDIRFVTNTSDGDATTAGNQGSRTIPSYKNCLLKVTVANTNYNNGFADRYGFIRVWGGHTSPVFLNAKPDGTPIPLNDATEDYYVPITIPGIGTREFMAEILDENFTVLAQSTKATMEVTDSGQEPPPDYNDGESDSRS